MPMAGGWLEDSLADEGVGGWVGDKGRVVGWWRVGVAPITERSCGSVARLKKS